MKRDFLEGLGIEADVINKIMAENGKDIENAKAKFADYDDLKKQIESANETIEKFKDYDQTKADVEKYKAEAKKAQEEASAKIAKLELQSKVKDFTSSKKFVNDFTRNAINDQLEQLLEDVGSKGKSLEELFNTLTDGKTDILVDENKPTPPVVKQINGENSSTDGVLNAFKAINPNIKL